MTEHRKKQQRFATGLEPRDPRYKDSIMTVPNVICFMRMAGSLILFGLAVAGYRHAFVGLFLFLSLSDWVDGKLARWLHQRSDFGARLDSAADAVLYTALIGGALLLSWETLRHEIVWISVAASSYALTSGAGLWKYGRIPSYHTYGAKCSQWLVLIAGICVILGWAVWPLRIAMVAVTLTNLEATAITFLLKQWQADVLTILHVLRPADRCVEK